MGLTRHPERNSATGPNVQLPDDPMTTKRPSSPDDLFPVIYGELRRVAGRYLKRERQNHTLQPTALVHEAWLKLQNERSVQLHGRTHGLALAAQAMRRLLVDHGRSRSATSVGAACSRSRSTIC